MGPCRRACEGGGARQAPILEDLRDEYAPAGEMRWKFRNSLTAPLARFLLQEVPEVGPYMALGRSKVDRYFDGTCSPPEAAGCDA